MNTAIFDVDGVIVDTYELNKQAYRRAGVQMPPHVFGRAWHEWLPQVCGSYAEAERVHRIKAEWYNEQVLKNDIPVLPGLKAVKKLMTERWYCVFCSNSPQVLLDHFLERFQLSYVNAYSTAGRRKPEVLCDVIAELNTRPEDVIVYVDDNYYAGLECADVAKVRFIHYTGDADEVLTQIGVA